MLDHVKNAVRNKQQITSNAEHFKGILHFLITYGLSTDCSMEEFIHIFFGRALFKKTWKCKIAKDTIFQFHDLKFSHERYFGFSCYYIH